MNFDIKYFEIPRKKLNNIAHYLTLTAKLDDNKLHTPSDMFAYEIVSALRDHKRITIIITEPGDKDEDE